jgi:hypothetical protein
MSLTGYNMPDGCSDYDLPENVELAPNQQETVDTLNRLKKEYKDFQLRIESEFPEHLKNMDCMELLELLAWCGEDVNDYLPEPEITDWRI